MNPSTVSRLRAVTSTDGRGSQIRDWANASSAEIEGVFLAPASSGEGHNDSRESVGKGWSLFSLNPLDLLATDRVQANGLTFEVDGEPEAWDSPWGGISGVTAKLTRVEG